MYQLSRRVDETHEAVRALDTRFEVHRQQTDRRLDRVLEGIATITAEQARQAAAQVAEDKAVERLTERTGQRLLTKANFLSKGLIVVTLVSTVIAAVALVAHP